LTSASKHAPSILKRSKVRQQQHLVRNQLWVTQKFKLFTTLAVSLRFQTKKLKSMLRRKRNVRKCWK
jgi:hypothetical protein